MWFWRGTQSAIFYYVACTPCQEAEYKKKRRKDAQRTQKERDALELEQPGLIQQPVPFETNRYWAEEIEAGPGPPSGWSGHDKPTPRKSNLAQPKRQSVFALKHQNENQTGVAAGAAGLPSTDLVSAQPSTRETFKEGIKAAMSPENWNFIRHDRPDEILWGYEPISKLLKGKGRDGSLSNPASQSTNALRRHRALTTDSDASYEYTHVVRNPEINDLHPPVVSMLPRSKDEVAWMIQPPPPAAVMAGKVHPDDAPIALRPRPSPPSNPRTSPKKANRDRERSRTRPPAIVISDTVTSSPSITPSSSRASSLSPSRHRARSQAPRTRKPPNNRSRTVPINGGRSPLATIVSYDTADQQYHQRIVSTPSLALNSRSSSPYSMKSPLPYDRMLPDGRSSDKNGTQTPPEWDFLLAQLYSPTQESGPGLENVDSPNAYRPVPFRRASARASWHGHERRWSEI